ncbi:unnamed protein product, partial [Heterosigma akashiwo]
AGHLKIVEALLKMNASVKLVENVENETALIQAARGGHLAIIEALLARGAEVNHLAGPN